MVWCSLKNNTYYDSQESVLEYNIKNGAGDVIFYGRSVKSPKTAKNRINVSQKIRDYLASDLGAGWYSGSTEIIRQQLDAFGFFTLNQITNEQEVLLETYGFLLDWIDAFDGNDKVLSEPVSGKLDPRMKFFFTRYGETDANFNFELGYNTFHIIFSGGTDFDFQQQQRTLFLEDCTNWGVVSASTTSDWFSVAKNIYGYSSLTIYVDENSGSTQREGTFSLCWPGKNFEPQCNVYDVVQDREHLEITFSGDTDFSFNQGTYTVAYTANTQIEAISASSWISDITITGNETGTITFTISANDGDTRQGFIQFRRANCSFGEIKELNISQGSYVWEFELLSSSATFNYYSGSTSIGFITNGNPEWLIFETPSWITATTVGNNIVLTASAYSGSGQRTGNVIIKANYPYSVTLGTIAVSQSEFYFEFVDPSQEHIITDFNAVTEVIPVRTNARNIIISSDTQWITGVYSNSIIYLTVNYNEEENTRAGYAYIYADVSNSPIAYISVYQTDNTAHITDYFTIEALSDGYVTMYSDYYYDVPNITFSYRKNSGDWNTVSAKTAVNINEGDIVELKKSIGARGSLSGDCECNVYGNIMSLEYGDNFVGVHYVHNLYFISAFQKFNKIKSASGLVLPATALTYGCYAGMFDGCTSLQAAPVLPATVLADDCYDMMFYGCTSLRTAPELPATVLADSCYNFMFYGCTSLTTAPVLPATVLADSCYSGMFDGCTSLQAAPVLPATVLAYGCYDTMFYGCSSIENAPALPATTLANYCYHLMFTNTPIQSAPVLPATALTYGCYESMFAGCINLANAPALPVTTLAGHCYDSMFKDCISITTAPELPATALTNYCYAGMFSGCTSLQAAPVLPATVLANGCYSGMFAGCINLANAPALPVTTLAGHCYNSMFKDCISITTAPELPATSITTGCYAYMFKGCTSLTTAPELPATKFTDECYRQMFQGCTSLITAPDLPASAGSMYYSYEGMFSGCTNLVNIPTILPATALSVSCYERMFGGCPSITTAPILPAKVLSDYKCYDTMFLGCTSLNYVKCLAESIDYGESDSVSRVTHWWLSRVSPTGTFVKKRGFNKWRSGSDGIPTGWTVVEADN